MSNQYRWSIILLSLLLLVLNSGSALAADEPLTVEADRLVISADGEYVEAEGHVKLVYADITLTAESLKIQRQIATAAGAVKLTSARGELTADLIELNLADQAVRAENPRGCMDGLYLSAAAMVPEGDGGETLTDASITRCELDVPCYALLAGRIILKGRRVTVEHGWLALLGLRIIPLPSLSLDLDDADSWPRLTGGYDTEGLFLTVGVPFRLSDYLTLDLEGEIAARDPLALTVAMIWTPRPELELSPWVAGSWNGRREGGLKANVRLGGAVLTAAGSIDQAQDLTGASCSLALPSCGFFGGSLGLRLFGEYERTSGDPPLTETGISISWTDDITSVDRTMLALDLGRAGDGAAYSPLLRLRADIARPIAPSWTFDLSLSYDINKATWLKTETGLTKYFHCYFLRAVADWQEQTYMLTGGISF